MSSISGKLYRPCDEYFAYSDCSEPFVHQNHNVWHQRPEVVAPHTGMVSGATITHLGPTTTTPANAIILNQTIECEEKPEAYVIKVQVPGLNKEEVKLELEEGGFVLCITCEKKVEREERFDSWCRVQRGSGRFVRRFRLPEKAKAEKMKARMENQLLTITIQKSCTRKCSETIHIY